MDNYYNPNDVARLVQIARNFQNSYNTNITPQYWDRTDPNKITELVNRINQYRASGVIPPDERGYYDYNYMGNW